MAPDIHLGGSSRGRCQAFLQQKALVQKWGLEALIYLDLRIVGRGDIRKFSGESIGNWGFFKNFVIFFFPSQSFPFLLFSLASSLHSISDIPFTL